MENGKLKLFVPRRRKTDKNQFAAGNVAPPNGVQKTSFISLAGEITA